MHDIGKNIVVIFLKGVGFEVIDIGTDVSAEKFGDAVRRKNRRYSGSRPCSRRPCTKSARSLRRWRKGLRSRVKVVAGGAPVTEEFALRMGADAYAADGGQAIKVCKGLLKG